jgi:hypothetical protein
MTILIACAIVVVTAAVAITAMLLMRRRAPEGSWFQDGDRASGVFGVLATGFAVMIGFVIFLAFESFDTSRSGAEAEAEIVAQQVETAQFMPAAVRDRLTGQLVCYARAVIGVEWPAMQSGSIGDAFNPWGVPLFRTLQQADPKTATEEAAYSKWLDERSDRESARSDRTHGAEGVIPTPLWIVLFLTAAIIFVFMLFFADPTEAWFVQATMMGGVAAVISSALVLLWFLDNPYHEGPGGLGPVAMGRTLRVMDKELEIVGRRIVIPCDAHGVATS